MKDNDYLIKKSFQGYLVPSILAILGGNISFMADHIIAGKVLGGDALAAMSMTGPLFFLFTAIGTLICVGSSTMASVYLGKEDRCGANKLFTLAGLLILLCGGLFTVAGFAFLEPIVNFLSGGSELHLLVRDYCRGFIPGAVCIMAVYLPLNFFRIEGRGYLGMIMFLILSVLDIVLDLYFTIALGLGMYGLSVATVISSLIATCAVTPFLFFKGGGYRLVSVKKTLRLINSIFIVGSPPALNNFYSVVRSLVLNIIIFSAGGPAAVAGFAFTNSVNTLAQAIISGMAQTVSPLVGVLFGEHDVMSIKKVCKLAVRLGIASMLVFGILLSVFSRQLCILFGLTSAVEQAIAVPALILSAVSLSGVMINQILCYYYMTIGRTRIANLITLCRGLLFILSAAFILSRIFGIVGIWISFSVSEALTLIITALVVKRMLLKETKLRGMLLLDHRDVDEGRYISFTVDTNQEAVVESSSKISSFCDKCELSPKQSMIIGLAIEEILLLMIQHVFADKENEAIDVKIFVRDESTIMRFRCGGRKFNPLAYYQAEMKQDGEARDMKADESMGLQLISKMAKQVDYSTNLGLNNIVVRI
ncbi:MAG: hypothetical protein GX115_17600 [Ruminiclostridium sp.]|nr:hypothetical protein [Ruminiclostridium sp.]